MTESSVADANGPETKKKAATRKADQDRRLEPDASWSSPATGAPMRAPTPPGCRGSSTSPTSG